MSSSPPFGGRRNGWRAGGRSGAGSHRGSARTKVEGRHVRHVPHLDRFALRSLDRDCWRLAFNLGAGQFRDRPRIVFRPGRRLFPRVPDVVRITRRLPALWPQHHPVTIQYRVENCSPLPCRLAWIDHQPESITVLAPSPPLILSAHESRIVTMSCRAERRGTWTWPRLDVVVEGPWGFLQRSARREMVDSIRVRPALRHEISSSPPRALVSQRQPGGRAGMGLSDGPDFTSLRERTTDDDWRRLDWKASARLGKWMVREDQAQQRQRLVVALDAGRWMAMTHERGTLFDQAVTTATRLVESALASGDTVSLCVFHREKVIEVGPGKGTSHLNRLLEALTDAEPARVTTDPWQVHEHVRRHHLRRALVLGITNVADLSSARAWGNVFSRLHPRHLTWVVSLLDPEVKKILDEPVIGTEDFYRYAAADTLTQERHQSLVALRRSGCLTLQTSASQLTEATLRQMAKLRKSRQW